MQRLVETRHAIVGAVHGQGVLDEVVGPDAEEVSFSRQDVRGQRRRGQLDHDADRDLRHGVAAVAQRCRGRGDGGPGGAELFEAGDEWEHHAQRTVRRGTKKGAQLRLEDLVDRQAEPDAAQAEGRPRAFDRGVLDAELRFADIEGADGDPPRGGALDEPAVGAILRFFGERRLPCSGEEELGSETPDPESTASTRQDGSPDRPRRTRRRSSAARWPRPRAHDPADGCRPAR